MTTPRNSGLTLPLALAFALCASCAPPTDDVPRDREPAPDSGTAYDDTTDAPGSSDRTLQFYYGPMKIMPAELILCSIASVTGHSFGAWDFTAPEPIARAFFDASNADGTFYRHCRQLGGCMEHRIPLGRTDSVNTAFVLQLERAVVEACNDRDAFGMFPGDAPPGEGALASDIIDHQYLRIFGTRPSDADRDLSRAYFEGHVRDPELDDVSPLESAARGHCRALLTTNRFLFY